MRHPDWDESENENYNRLSKVREGSVEGQIESLAYTAVMEMYHARKEKEKLQAEKKKITDALDQIADGICTLERILGCNLAKMSERHKDELFRSSLKDYSHRIATTKDIENNKAKNCGACFRWCKHRGESRQVVCKSFKG